MEAVKVVEATCNNSYGVTAEFSKDPECANRRLGGSFDRAAVDHLALLSTGEPAYNRGFCGEALVLLAAKDTLYRFLPLTSFPDGCG